MKLYPYLEWPQDHPQVGHIPEDGDGDDVARNDAQCDGLSVSGMLEVPSEDGMILRLRIRNYTRSAFKRLPRRHFYR